jgi:putative ABC transport system ATP-binding protein
MSFIVLENVKKSYQSEGSSAPTGVLHGISAEVGQGEFVALMGPSGSGKTTLLTVIGAMNQPSAGKVIIDDIETYGLSEERRADFRHEYLGFIFQQHHLLPYLTALENVMLPLAIAPLSGVVKRTRAGKALERVGLADKFARLPGELSGGEQGRVAIARALVNDPPIILADEPTGSLDSRTGEEVIALLRALNDQGETILMVTHSEEAARSAHRILRIQDGRLRED